MLTTCILYCYAAAGPGCLINCYKLCRFLSRKLNEVQCQFISSRCIYCYWFVYILYRLLNKQLRQLPRKRSLSENRSYHIRINKQRFCQQNNCCLPSLCHFTRTKYCWPRGRRALNWFVVTKHTGRAVPAKTATYKRLNFRNPPFSDWTSRKSFNFLFSERAIRFF